MQSDEEFEQEYRDLLRDIDESTSQLDKERPIGACYRYRLSTLLKKYREHAVDSCISWQIASLFYEQNYN